MGCKLSLQDLVNSKADGTLQEVETFLQEYGKDGISVEEILKNAKASIHVLWNADLVDAQMLLIPNEDEWYLLVDRSVSDFDKDIPLRIAQDYIEQILLHEIWHFHSKKQAIDACSWVNPMDGDAFAPAELDEREEKIAELFSIYTRLGNPEKFIQKVMSEDFDVDKISKEYHNTEPEDIVKYFIAWNSSDSSPWHYFKYSMGKSVYDEEYIPSVYTQEARAKLRDENYMRNADTALNKAIANFFTCEEKTDTVHVHSTIEREHFLCHATYHKFPYKKGQRHNVTCFGTPEPIR
ncbi:MAG: hypothetical protein E7055_20385 [Lentisphaerae bacterium]|nr:hypothetical protein [Lentisphaerota bacterium]